MDKDGSAFKTFGIIISFISAALLITIFALDITLMTQITNSASIAFAEISSIISYTGITTGIYILAILYLISFFSIILDGTIILPFISLISLLCILLLEIPREAIVFKFVSCFSFYNYGIVIARCSITFLCIIFLFVLQIKYLIRKADQKHIKIINIISFIISIFVLIAIIVLNILMLVNLSNSNTEISPNEIHIGYFSDEEILKIQNGTYVRDSNFKLRLLGKLSDLIYSQNKVLSFRTCSRSSCTNYYLRMLNVIIQCNNESSVFYKDCQSATYLNIFLRYVDRGPYPSYNCAIYRNTTCELGCPNLLSSYSLNLIQQTSDKLELAWNGFSKCEIKQPKVKLSFDNVVNICDLNSSLTISPNFIHSIFFTSFAILVNIFIN